MLDARGDLADDVGGLDGQAAVVFGPGLVVPSVAGGDDRKVAGLAGRQGHSAVAAQMGGDRRGGGDGDGAPVAASLQPQPWLAGLGGQDQLTAVLAGLAAQVFDEDDGTLVAAVVEAEPISVTPQQAGDDIRITGVLALGQADAVPPARGVRVGGEVQDQVAGVAAGVEQPVPGGDQATFSRYPDHPQIGGALAVVRVVDVQDAMRGGDLFDEGACLRLGRFGLGRPCGVWRWAMQEFAACPCEDKSADRAGQCHPHQVLFREGIR